jgi:DNA polymerase I
MKKENISRLVLLDTHAIIHRAFHALPDFSTSKGEPTGALYGLVAMLLKIVEDLKPDYLIACRDLPGKTHRHEVYEHYKAQRPSAEPELVAQLQRAPKIFEAFGIPMYALPGYEADDMLGTIVKQISLRSDIKTIIASGDLDTLQLVGERVSVYTLRKGLNDTIVYDEFLVRQRFGFGPERMIDYKALRGDPSDNIPGIKGIGEKTATDLITKFGSLDSMYEVAELSPEKMIKAGIKPRIVELLKNGKADAAFSKDLATIHTNAPITFVLPKTHWHLVDHAATISALCDELEFKALKQRIATLTKEKTPPPEGPESVTQPLEFVAPPPEKRSLDETSVALWLLRSDYSAPSLEDILAYGDTRDFGVAREKIFTDLRATGYLADVYEKIEYPLIPVVQRMNETGVSIDVPYLEKLSKEYTAELQKIEARIYGHAGHEFNINSPKQLGVVLYDELKITPERQKRTATGARTTREDELVKMRELHPIIDDILAQRELQKLLSTYVDKIPGLVRDGRLYTTFLQAGTTTGRIACADPNLQNIPIKTEYGRRIREAFTATKGFVLASIDYSQIELRIAAGLSGDENLVRVFRDGGDVHAAVAARVFNVPEEVVDKEMRRRAKIINFGILYGMGVNALRVNLGATVTREEASKFLEEYFKNFAGLHRWLEHVKQNAARTGYTETLFGRRRYFPGFKSPLPQLRAQAERMAINAPIQGTQSDIIKLAMVEADKLIDVKGWKNDVRLVMQVHDELVYEIVEDSAERIAMELRKAMEKVAPVEKLSHVPILAEASIGKNWGDMGRLSR